MWHIFSSPITARSLVRAKYAFVMYFSTAIMSVCFVVSGLFAPPLMEVVIISLIEAMLLIISLSFGIKGFDFPKFPRPRMIRAKYSVINLIVCILLALAIVSPIIPYSLKILLEAIQAPAAISISLSESYRYIGSLISGVIAFVVTYMFHRITVKNAEEFLIKAEI